MGLLWADLCPNSDSYLEVLMLSTLESVHIWM
jgi:hypothetical protein